MGLSILGFEFFYVGFGIGNRSVNFIAAELLIIKTKKSNQKLLNVERYILVSRSQPVPRVSKPITRTLPSIITPNERTTFTQGPQTFTQHPTQYTRLKVPLLADQQHQTIFCIKIRCNTNVFYIIILVECFLLPEKNLSPTRKNIYIANNF
jgi:hypothetical protein